MFSQRSNTNGSVRTSSALGDVLCLARVTASLQGGVDDGRAVYAVHTTLIVGWQNEQGISDMRRPNPKIAPEDAHMLWEKTHPSVESDFVVAVRCTLITPMFGGGVRPGEVDCDMPIRASALRGQLRFWWRLLNGAGRKPTDLFIAESALWGGISSKGPRASQVTLQVKAAPAGDQQLIRSRQPDIPAYALILEPGGDPQLLDAGYDFELVLALQANGDGAAARAGH